MVFPVYAATLRSSSSSPLGSGIVAEGDHDDPLCVDLALFRSIKQDLYLSLAPALVYLPHGHTCGDNGMEFAPSGPACDPEDLQVKECFMRAHDEGEASHIS